MEKQRELDSALGVAIKLAMGEAVDLGLKIIWFDNSYIWQHRRQPIGLYSDNKTIYVPLEASEQDILDTLEEAIQKYKAQMPIMIFLTLIWNEKVDLTKIRNL